MDDWKQIQEDLRAGVYGDWNEIRHNIAEDFAAESPGHGLGSSDINHIAYGWVKSERLTKPTCHWLIEVASGNPEPDFPEDLYRTIECGAPVVFNEYGSWKCEAGHEHVSYDDPARGSYEAEQVYRERQEG
jgi:hypothetical protein